MPRKEMSNQSLYPDLVGLNIRPANGSHTSSVADGLPALLELLRVLVNILDPNDQVHTDSTRLTALTILNSIIETCGTRIGDYPSLAVLILDSGCKYLFQLARSDNPAVLQGALRTISSLFETMQPHLKLQQELFLAFSIDRLATPPLSGSSATKKYQVNSPRPGTSATSTPNLGPVDTELDLEGGSPVPSRPPVQPARGDTRDLMLETLSQISRHPSFMVDLYTNYDCDINCENLFERLIEFLTKVGRVGILICPILIFIHRVYMHGTTRPLWRHSNCIRNTFV